MNNQQENPTNLSAHVFDLAGLIDYHTDSIVSREVLSKKTGTVTVFAFAQEQGLSEHTVPFDALVYILEGKAKITISGQDYTLNNGEMITMPANEPHALMALGEFKMVLVMIKS
ncbi:cupin [candidate division WOR_3 bacterium SM23_42]|uniref:Cupin n=1 Tax=candidate division WOR_3 bacterium SM23_42 TaxID=1703779 RepID=A0A0S8FWM5_UNCW3|nr:MAG: cupin [candidate division WOR_3 bacterium SM23_42]